MLLDAAGAGRAHPPSQLGTGRGGRTFFRSSRIIPKEGDGHQVIGWQRIAPAVRHEPGHDPMKTSAAG
jgi:hypothetical protein